MVQTSHFVSLSLSKLSSPLDVASHAVVFSGLARILYLNTSPVKTTAWEATWDVANHKFIAFVVERIFERQRQWRAVR